MHIIGNSHPTIKKDIGQGVLYMSYGFCATELQERYIIILIIHSKKYLPKVH